MGTYGISLLIDYDLLVENRISLESWFILYCLGNNRLELLNDYVDNCGVIKLANFINLRDNGYILITSKEGENITIKTLKITEKGLSLFKSTVDNNKLFEDCFEQLKNTYPSKVPTENGTFRRLHGDLARCKKLYKKILYENDNINNDLHKSILKAINKQVEEYTKGKRLPFMQNLVTYLHQMNYIQYLNVDKNEAVSNNENRTILGTNKF